MDDWGDWHEGDLVRVTFKFALGTVAEGRLERRQDRLVLPWSECDWWNVILHDGSVCPNLKVEKIDEPDEGCERITDIDEVRVGDVAVFDGIKGKVASVASDSENGYGKLQVYVPGACFARCAWMQDSAFRYALRKRPALPTKSGFYCDRHGDMWIVGRMKGKDGLHAAPLTETDRYLPGKIAVPLETDGMSSYAPFTRVEFMPAKDGE